MFSRVLHILWGTYLGTKPGCLGHPGDRYSYTYRHDITLGIILGLIVAN